VKSGIEWISFASKIEFDNSSDEADQVSGCGAHAREDSHCDKPALLAN
jgi:hypothetical protein